MSNKATVTIDADQYYELIRKLEMYETALNSDYLTFEWQGEKFYFKPNERDEFIKVIVGMLERMSDYSHRLSDKLWRIDVSKKPWCKKLF